MSYLQMAFKTELTNLNKQILWILWTYKHAFYEVQPDKVYMHLNYMGLILQPNLKNELIYIYLMKTNVILARILHSWPTLQYINIKRKILRKMYTL